MIKAGIETLIRPQLNDEVITHIETFFGKLHKLCTQFYIKDIITPSEFNTSFTKLQEEFDTIIYNRFNFHITMKPYSTFAILPIFNQDLKVTKPLSITKDIKKALKQIKEFSYYIEDNEVLIDTKNAKFHNFKDTWVMTYLIDPEMIPLLTARDFTVITLHEIGHVFTLIEMYSNTTRQTASLSKALLSIDPYGELCKYIGISKKDKDNTKDVSLLLYDKVDDDMEKVFLAYGRDDVDTDSEYEADDFVSKFGLSGDLTTTLVKLTDAEKLGLSRAPILFLTMTTLDNLAFLILAVLLVDLPLAISLVVISMLVKITVFIFDITNVTKNRNPSGDEHGDFGTRVEHLRAGIISVIRTTSLDTKEKKRLLKQLDAIDNKIDIINKSIYNSILGSLVNDLLKPNLNIRDELSSLLSSLIDNELYVSQARFGVGVENRLAAIKPNVFITKDSLFSNWLVNIFNNTEDKIFSTLNELLDKYGLYVEYKDGSLTVRSFNDLTISTGISTIAFIPVETSETIITLTLDAVKLNYLLANDKITVYDIQKIQLTDTKFLYLVEVERCKHISYKSELGEQLNKLVDDMDAAVTRHREEYGSSTAAVQLDIMLASDVPNLDLLKTDLMLARSTIDGLPNTVAINLDLHMGNIMLNKTGRIVITDPIYYSAGLASKVSNDIDIDNL